MENQPVGDGGLDIPQNKTKDTGRQGADPYEYAERENESVGDGGLACGLMFAARIVLCAN